VVSSTQSITETITAPYVRFDARLLDDRFSLTAGVRYENTRNEGVGGLVDPSRIYQRDASRDIVRDDAGQPVVLAPLASVAGTKLAYVMNGARTSRSYGDFFPSVNGSFAFRPKLIGRVSYARSIARPSFNYILPTVNLPDPATENRAITLTNPDLKPWTANSYGLSLEYYFDAPSTGVISVRAYRRDITDFWRLTSQPATDEFLNFYGLDPQLYGAALGYTVSTRANSGHARVSGLEIDYRQNLAFLPRWARGFTVFGNLTLQRLEGPVLSDFSGFVPRTFNYGVSLSRERFTARVSVNLRGLQRGAAVTHLGAEPGTYSYILPRRSADLTLEYRLTRNFSLFASSRNVNGATDDAVDYGPSTPRYSIMEARGDYRANWSIGLKGTF
jgi:iron complex outermembrane recepter protein